MQYLQEYDTAEWPVLEHPAPALCRTYISQDSE